jgi:hypothetical protein
MSNRWATGSVADISINDAGGRPCRVNVLDGEPFTQTLVGSTQVALDLTVHTQLLARTDASIRFGIHVAQVPVQFRDDVVASIEIYLADGLPFPVILADDAGADSIDVLCVPDWEAQGSLYKRGPIAAGYIKDFVMRFVTKGPSA